jgi:hypothetical protein
MLKFIFSFWSSFAPLKCLKDLLMQRFETILMETNQMHFKGTLSLDNHYSYTMNSLKMAERVLELSEKAKSKFEDLKRRYRKDRLARSPSSTSTNGALLLECPLINARPIILRRLES